MLLIANIDFVGIKGADIGTIIIAVASTSTVKADAVLRYPAINPRRHPGVLNIQPFIHIKVIGKVELRIRVRAAIGPRILRSVLPVVIIHMTVSAGKR